MKLELETHVMPVLSWSSNDWNFWNFRPPSSTLLAFHHDSWV